MAITDKLTAIANAIRGKTGKQDTMTLDQMAVEISGIETEPVVEPLNITENGTYNPQPGVDGYSPVIVNVQSAGVNGLPYDMGEFILEEDSLAGTEIPHNLGAIPDFVMVWTDELADTPIPTDFADSFGFIYARKWMGIGRQYSSSMYSSYGDKTQTMTFIRAKNATMNNLTVGPTADAYAANGAVYTAEKFRTHGMTAANGSRWRAGVTYRYFVAKAWWNMKEVTE